jgi:CheY-like chemotaxis protein
VFYELSTMMQGARQQLAVSTTTRILVAEDHADSRDALRYLLEAFGFEVVIAANGHSAIEIALTTRPGLILMDLMMPGINGLDAIRELRKDPRTHDVPIIAVTAVDSLQEAIDAGANDFVRKPVDLRHLIWLINRWIPREAT